ncbi:DUF1353 domain-containing protein [Spiribacter halobius]|uniref:DUF1353 domain-containing protein n=1 Tax=Sediminicurvatus halobius TaxID=2182432 RepID=A0A2U2MXN5_9GAMM|nr:DUF1353 domain-containing protein [Spiribacter halobius]PWG61755.1 hypothetical protein DEM34_14920 [Spiribacter halobius]UEX76811.1 DUF1353 domain-containing protein [Spiribacter halobius]
MTDHGLYQRLEPISASEWLTTEPIRVYALGTRHVVPAGFVTDGASIPRALWPIVGHPMGRYWPAAVVHDHLVRQPATPRSEADAVFRVLLRRLGVAWWRRAVLYAGVQIGALWARLRVQG